MAKPVQTNPLEDSNSVCPNCGAEVSGKFCASCGQRAEIGIPTVWELIHDTLAAVFSYDSKVWRTLGALIGHPGQLTVDYFAGKRARYLTPLQIFFWLEALAFLAHRKIFSNDVAAADAKARALLVVGGFLAVAFSLIYIRRKLRFVFHLVAAVHIWAFLMLWLIIEYAIVPGAITLLIRIHVLHGLIEEGVFVTLSTMAVMLVYILFALRRIYQVHWLYAAVQTALLLEAFILSARYLPL